MSTSVLLDDTGATLDPADLDLDVQVAGISPDAVFGATPAGDANARVTEGSTSPSTYGVQSRCPVCCC
ncbi:hypothetical protein [Streptomyces hoynatensis]|uniref:Uncharacterized protein n=1 Tax=Streptomyces hoynatensis TaxID=1141874 RepID=A0A3A9ZB78_9ACTN|nr:hypothetical protein [Streptomyces hoynatensis]RKN45712.1 hypothetical protein D7294_04405 [Streptomyces hoynatensis]